MAVHAVVGSSPGCRQYAAQLFNLRNIGCNEHPITLKPLKVKGLVITNNTSMLFTCHPTPTPTLCYLYRCFCFHIPAKLRVM